MNLPNSLTPPRILSLSVLLLSFSAMAWSRVQERDPLPAAESATRAGKFDLAAQLYQKLAESQPRSAELWSNLGAVRIMAGDCQGAFVALDRARSLNPKLFAPWYFAGLCHLQFHHDREAVECLTRAVQLNSRDARAWYLEAQAAGNVERLGLAFQAAMKALSLDPTRPESYYLAGKASLDLAAACYQHVQANPGPYPDRLEGERDAAQAVWEAALQSYRQAAARTPRDSDIHFGLGTVYLEMGNLSQAEVELRRCLEIVPGSTWTKLRLALVLTRAGKEPAAQAILDALGPEHLEAPEEFGDYLACAYLLNLTARARQALARAQERFPENPDFAAWPARLASLPSASAIPSLELRGLTGVGLSVRFILAADPPVGNFVAALFSSARQYREFRDAFLRLDLVRVAGAISPQVENLPKDPGKAFALGEVLHWLSYRLYERLGTAYPDSEAAQRLAAENFSTQGQQDKALEIYKAMLSKGNSPDLLRDIARIYWTERRWDEASRVLQSLVELDPHDPTVFVNLGRIESYRHNLESAEHYFQRAAEIDPKMFEAHLGLGETLRGKGNQQDALREFRIASDLDPGNPRPHYELSQIYRRLDHKDLANREMETFQRLQAQAASDKTRKNQQLVPIN